MDNARKIKTPKVLAIMINGHQDIDGQCLWTLTNQDYPNLEIIVRCEKPKLVGKNPVETLYLNCAANRERARALALKTNADYFFFVDADIILPAEDIISRLVKQITQTSPARMQNPVTGQMMTVKPKHRKKHMIGGWYRTNNPHKWVGGKWIDNNKFTNYFKPQESVVETDMVGLGCALISRELLKQVHFRPGIDTHADNVATCPCNDCKGKVAEGAMLGECLDFGNQVSKKGYKMFLDGDIVCGHVKRINNERVVLA